MRYLIDTNVLSETVRPKPNRGVEEFLRGEKPLHLCISALTLGELRHGVERLATGKKQQALQHWLDSDLAAWFEGRILPVDEKVADTWGRLLARSRRTLPAVDSLLAATALTHGLTLVTHNTKDFYLPGLETIDPWR